MSKAPTLYNGNDEPPEDEDPAEVVEENRDLFERIAESDLPMSDRMRATIDYVDQEGKDA